MDLTQLQKLIHIVDRIKKMSAPEEIVAKSSINQ
jgi:hypothetical protein